MAMSDGAGGVVEHGLMKDDKVEEDADGDE